MALSKAFLLVVLGLVLAVISAQAATPASSPAPAPTSGAGAVSPSFGFACFAAAVALLCAYVLKI